MNWDRGIFGEGTAEAVWEYWLQPRKKTHALEDWLPRTARLVVVAPHPDDEVLACGGLIATHRENGGDIAVVAVTDGEASHAGSPLWEPQALAVTRRSESIAGLHKLGVSESSVKRLAIPDGKVAQYTFHLARQLKLLLRPSDLVLTTWRFDGHPDHDATARAASLACSLIGCRLIEAPVWMWHWASPGDPDVPWHHLYCLSLAASARERKKEALAAHVSQLNASNRVEGAVLGENILARANRAEEYFFAT